MPAARAFCASRAISSSIFLPTTIIRSASSSMTTTMKGSRSSGSGASGSDQAERVADRLAALGRLVDFLVEASQIAHALLAHQLVAALHLVDAPVQRVGRLLHVGHDRRQQMRNAFVDAHFQHLRVDHDQAHIARLGLVEQAQDHRVDADRLAGTGGAGHQAMRHLGQVGHHRCADDVLAQGHGQQRGGVGIDLGAEDFGQADGLATRVGQLQRHVVLAGDRLDDADRHQAQLRARSLARPTICEPLTPVAGSIS